MWHFLWPNWGNDAAQKYPHKLQGTMTTRCQNIMFCSEVLTPDWWRILLSRYFCFYFRRYCVVIPANNRPKHFLGTSKRMYFFIYLFIMSWPWNEMLTQWKSSLPFLCWYIQPILQAITPFRVTLACEKTGFWLLKWTDKYSYSFQIRHFLHVLQLSLFPWKKNMILVFIDATVYIFFTSKCDLVMSLFPWKLKSDCSCCMRGRIIGFPTSERQLFFFFFFCTLTASWSLQLMGVVCRCCSWDIMTTSVSHSCVRLCKASRENTVPQCHSYINIKIERGNRIQLTWNHTE